MNILKHFEKIIEFARENGLCDAFFEKAREDIDAAAAVLNISPVQTAIFALMLEHFGETSVSIDDIAKTIKCGKMQMLQYMDDIDFLKKRKLIRAAGHHRFPFEPRSAGLPEYIIPMDVIEAVRKGVEYQCKEYDNLSPEEFFDCAESLLRAAKNDDMNSATLIDEINYLLERNKNICFTKKKDEYGLGEGSVLIMFVFCCALLHDNEETLESDDLMNQLKEMIGHGEARSIYNRFKSQKHKLFVKKLVEFECQNSMADTDHYCLSQKARDEFLADIDLKEKTKHKGTDFIFAEKITSKKLFYSQNIRNRIKELTTLLMEENYRSIKKRLSDSSMRTGFACIFSGPPGTGKTETAYQIARETGRDIMMVDISDTKSMWFGGSEKRIKAVFNRYRGVVKSGGLAPILLFNEADGVLGKRRQLSDSRSGPDQTENAIQNIILQEMEDLNGILIATTNMTANLDKAFERRFLYKIEFEKPDAESKKLLWQSLIPSLAGEDAMRLAAKFDFSGGQIENIARKSTVSFILNGVDPDSSTLETFCREELLEKNTARIGFCA
jgi:hypothetical protein